MRDKSTGIDGHVYKYGKEINVIGHSLQHEKLKVLNDHTGICHMACHLQMAAAPFLEKKCIQTLVHY